MVGSEQRRRFINEAAGHMTDWNGERTPERRSDNDVKKRSLHVRRNLLSSLGSGSV